MREEIVKKRKKEEIPSKFLISLLVIAMQRIYYNGKYAVQVSCIDHRYKKNFYNFKKTVHRIYTKRLTFSEFHKHPKIQMKEQVSGTEHENIIDPFVLEISPFAVPVRQNSMI